MIRTLTLVSVLALVAGVAMGFFIASAADRPSVAARPPSAPALDAKVKTYVDEFGLTAADEQEVRATLIEYDQHIADVFRRLQQQHRDEFKALVERANARIEAVVAKYPKGKRGK